MADSDIWVNGADLSDPPFGFKAANMPDGMLPLDIVRGGIALLNRRGRAQTGGQVEKERYLTMVGNIFAADPAALVLASRALTDHMRVGLLEIRLGWYTDKVYFGWLDGIRVEPYKPQMANGAAKVTLRFLLDSPVLMDAAYRMYYAAAGERLECPLGSLESSPIYYIFGAATNPVFTLRNGAGDILTQITYTVTLNAASFLAINADSGRVQLSTAGTVTDADSLASLGDPFPLLSLRDGDFRGGVGPTVEVNNGLLGVRLRRGWDL